LILSSEIDIFSNLPIFFVIREGFLQYILHK
jgi:hypothetical protein